MPVARTRVCPSCHVSKVTPTDFRDAGEHGAGRPPRVCAECRAHSPELRAQQERNIAKRAAGRRYRAGLATRPGLQILAEQYHQHPFMEKVCPPAAGCGRKLPLSEFHINSHQRDGLHVLCISCRAAAAALPDA